MSSFEDIFTKHIGIAIASGDLDKADASKATQALVTEISLSILKGLKRQLSGMLRQHHKSDAGFIQRNYRRWRRPLDLLEMMCVIFEEVGSTFNDTYRPIAVQEKDYAFEALVTLHARSILVTREIICLLKGGFPDAALSRWRSLRELAVTAQFLCKHGGEVSHRYLASFHFNALRAAKQMNDYAERANLEKFSKEELDAMDKQCTAFAARFGDEMYNEYGWAADVLSGGRPNFALVEKDVALDHWRPRYKWASQHTHGGHRPPLAMLGTAESRQPVLLVGQSNSGFTDPIQMTAISLTLATSALLFTKPKLDAAIFVSVLDRISTEIGPLALEVERKTLKQSRLREAAKKASQPTG